MYKTYWRAKTTILNPIIVGIVRSAAFALLLLSIAVRALLHAISPAESSLTFLVFITIFASLTVVACLIEFLTRSSGYRPELTDVYEIRKAILRLDKFRSDARACDSEATLTIYFDDFIDDLLALACKATRHPNKAQLVLMLPTEDDDELEVVHVHPAAPEGVVNIGLRLPLKPDVEKPGPEHGLGAAGFAYRALFSVYVPNTTSRVAYWVHSDTGGGVNFTEIGPIWVPEDPETSRSMIAVPIFVAGRDDCSYPWGVVNFGSPRRDAFGSSDFYVAAVFASLIAQAFSITTAKSAAFTQATI